LCRELHLKKPDTEVHRLAFALVGMATIYAHGSRTVVEKLAPSLFTGKHARAVLLEKLVGYALVLVASERKRRQVEMKEQK
jgi:hypothetical protein